MLDDENRILWFNPAAERLLALRRPRDLGEDVTGLVRHPALADALAGGGPGRPLEIASPANCNPVINSWMVAPISRPIRPSRATAIARSTR